MRFNLDCSYDINHCIWFYFELLPFEYSECQQFEEHVASEALDEISLEYCFIDYQEAAELDFTFHFHHVYFSSTGLLLYRCLQPQTPACPDLVWLSHKGGGRSSAYL